MTTIQSTSKANIFDLTTNAGGTPGRQGLRFESASSAQGFAQVLQAFDRTTESPLTQPTDDRESSKLDASAQTSDAADEATGSTDEDAHEEGAIDSDADGRTNAQGATDQDAGAIDASQTTDTSIGAAQDTVDAQGDASDSLQQANAQLGLGLLVGQGDQAKLTIRGLVQSLQPQATPDLTAVAVSTRLGQDQLNVAQIQTQEINAKQATAPELEPTRTQSQTPIGQPQSGADANPADALSDQPPQSSRGPAEFGASSLGIKQVPAQAIPEPARGDQARVDVQQARSTRVEVSSPAPVSRTDMQAVKLNLGDAAVQIGKPTRAEGALTARAVTGVDASGEQTPLNQLGVQTQKSTGSIMPDTSEQRTALMAQVQRGLASMLRSGTGDMTIQLTPAHLGTIRIQMKRDGDRVALRMSTSNEGARELVGESTKELAALFECKGLEVEQIRVDLREPSTPDQGQGSASSGGDQQAQQGHHQSGVDGRSAQSTRDDHITPLEFNPGDLDADATGEIWTNLGLDTTA